MRLRRMSFAGRFEEDGDFNPACHARRCVDLIWFDPDGPLHDCSKRQLAVDLSYAQAPFAACDEGSR